MREKLDGSLGRVVSWGLIAATLLVTPSWSIDPINPIKMLVVVPVGFMCVGLLLANRKSVNWGNYKMVLGLVSGFVIWQVFVIFFSGGQTYRQLFGVQGRNTGLLTYFAFSFIFVGSLIAASNIFLKRFALVSVIAGSASLLYGVIQAIGLDPFNWVAVYSPVFGFLGNPNFQSSLLGVLGTIVFAQLLVKELKIQVKALIGVYLLITLYVIKETESEQGFLVLVFGIAVVIGLYVAHVNRRLGVVYGLLSIFGFFAVLFGSINKGPLASILFKDSLTYRLDYWQAGWQMTLDHPFFGVGMDGYGDWYRRSRSVEATLRTSADRVSDAAHNVYFDISSYGGFPLFIAYVALMVLVVISAVKVLRRSASFNPLFVGLFGGWVAFQAQSIISINQIGLAIWGWVISGLIIGYEINTRNVESVDLTRKKNRAVGVTEKTSAGTALAMSIAFGLGILFGAPPYIASVKYLNALETGDPLTIQKAAYTWPDDFSRYIQVALILNDNKLNAEALTVAVDATKKFPDNYHVWNILTQMNDASPDQKEEAFAQMKRLDPFNPDLK